MLPLYLACWMKREPRRKRENLEDSHLKAFVYLIFQCRCAVIAFGCYCIITMMFFETSGKLWWCSVWKNIWRSTFRVSFFTRIAKWCRGSKWRSKQRINTYLIFHRCCRRYKRKSSLCSMRKLHENITLRASPLDFQWLPLRLNFSGVSNKNNFYHPFFSTFLVHVKRTLSIFL